jgi:hypothetical protein
MYHIVTYRPIARQRQRNKPIYDSRYWLTASETNMFTRQQLKHNNEERCFLYGPGRSWVCGSVRLLKSVAKKTKRLYVSCFCRLNATNWWLSLYWELICSLIHYMFRSNWPSSGVYSDKDTAAHCNAVFLSITSASGYLVARGFSVMFDAVCYSFQ